MQILIARKKINEIQCSQTDLNSVFDLQKTQTLYKLEIDESVQTTTIGIAVSLLSVMHLLRSGPYSFNLKIDFTLLR